MQPLGSWLTSPTTGFLIKLFASVATAGFGLLGIGSKTRGDNGELTRNGWIAVTGVLVAGLLAFSSCIYDFVSSQEQERTAMIRSQHLLISVQRAVFPMRGLHVSVVLSLSGDIEALKTYKVRVREAISKDRGCNHANGQFRCYGMGLSGPELYMVPRDANLFPPQGSGLRRLLDSTYVHATVLREASIDGNDRASATRKPERLGRFFINWWKDGVPPSTSLIYDYPNDALSLDIENLGVGDEEVFTSGVYSLVDFLPGYMRLIPGLNVGSMCDSFSGKEVCSNEALHAFERGLALTRFVISFPYPKQIRGEISNTTRCRAEPGNGISTGIALELPVDVEGLDSLGNIVSPATLPKSPVSTCVLTDPQREKAPASPPG